MANDKMSSAIKGTIGEFYVASYLSALNLVVALPRGGVPASDLLVTNQEGTKTISLQVKTATKAHNQDRKYGYGGYLAWSISDKTKGKVSDLLWYVFVNLDENWPKGSSSPELYFVPSEDVSNLLKTDWNKEDASWKFFPIFSEINAENIIYAGVEKNAASYKGIEGFEKMNAHLK